MRPPAYLGIQFVEHTTGIFFVNTVFRRRTIGQGTRTSSDVILRWHKRSIIEYLKVNVVTLLPPNCLNIFSIYHEADKMGWYRPYLPKKYSCMLSKILSVNAFFPGIDWQCLLCEPR